MFGKPPDEFREYYEYLNGVIAQKNKFDAKNWTDLKEKFIEKFHSYFLAFSKKPRNYPDTHVGGLIFEILYYEKDIKSALLVHFFAIEKVLKRTSDRVMECTKPEDERFLLSELAYQREMVFEVAMFLSDNSKIIFGEEKSFGFGRRGQASSYEVFKTSRIFSQCGTMPEERPFILGSTATFLIRQAIELRIKNALGILYIFDQNGFSKISGESFVDILIEDDAIKFPMEKTTLLKIHKWTNYFIHGGFIPELWKIDWAHHLLMPLFAPGKAGNTHSIHGAIQIPQRNYDLIEEKIKDHIVGLNPNVKKETIQIIRNPHPEAIIT